MPNTKFLASLFTPPPERWGLRGDPYLWDEMKERAENIPLPKTIQELDEILQNLFIEIVGHAPEKDKNFFVEKYDNGGMSSGRVSSGFWLEKGFPLIISRFKF